MRANVLQFLTYAALSGSSLVTPLVAAQHGASLDMVGLIGTAHGAAGVLSNFIFGRLGDRADRRGIVGFGFAAGLVAYALQFWATTPTTLLLARFGVGFAAGIVPATLVAYVYDQKRPIGKFSSFNAMGWMAGSLLIVVAGVVPVYVFRPGALEAVRGSLDALGIYRVIFLASAAFCATGWLVARKLPSMHVHLDVPRFPAKVLVTNAPVYLSIFLRHLGATAIWAIYPIYVFQLGGGLSLVGWLHVFNMAAQILVFRSAERSARFGRPRTLILVGLVLSASVFACFAFVRTATQLLPFQLVVGVSFATLWLGCLKEVLVANVERSTASGLLNASMSLSNVVGPVVGGFVAAQWGFHAVMYFGSGATVVALLFYLLTDRSRAGRAERALPSARAASDVHP